MARSSLLSVVASAVIACGPELTAQNQSELRGGSIPLVAPPGVVGLHVECTAVKVAPRHFLTAAHCVVRTFQGVDVETLEPEGTFARQESMCLLPSITLDPGECMEVGIKRTLVHPSFATFAQTHLPRTPSSDISDLAVIEVDRDTPSISQAILDDASLAVSDDVLLTGYGCTSLAEPSQERTLRVGRTNLGDLTPTILSIDGESSIGGCPGDSGGPAYRGNGLEGRVVGINSYILADGRTVAARTDKGGDGRVWLDSILEASEAASTDGTHVETSQ